MDYCQKSYFPFITNNDRYISNDLMGGYNLLFFDKNNVPLVMEESFILPNQRILAPPQTKWVLLNQTKCIIPEEAGVYEISAILIHCYQIVLVKLVNDQDTPYLLKVSVKLEDGEENKLYERLMHPHSEYFTRFLIPQAAENLVFSTSNCYLEKPIAGGVQVTISEILGHRDPINM